MACRRFGTKPVAKPMPTLCQMEPKEHTIVKYEWKYRPCVKWNQKEQTIVKYEWKYKTFTSEEVAF